MSPPFECAVIYALPERQWRWCFSVEPGASIASLLARLAEHLQSLPVGERPAIDWTEIECGVFGEIRSRQDRLWPGDRLELYRPLTADPKVRRRARAASGSAAAGAARRGSAR